MLYVFDFDEISDLNYVGEAHDRFVTMLKTATNEIGAKEVIVSPTAMIIQCSKNGDFIWHREITPDPTFEKINGINPIWMLGIKSVGYIGDLVDTYMDDNAIMTIKSDRGKNQIKIKNVKFF